MMVQGFVSTTPTPKLLVSCAGHLMTQCFIALTIARASLHLSSWTKRTELSTKQGRKLTPVPSSGFVVSRRVGGTPSCQSPRTRSLRTLARCISWVVTYSQTGAEELRPKTPSGAAVMVSHGPSLTVVCFTHREEELAFCMAGISQWQEPNSLLQSKPFGCAGVLRSRVFHLDLLYVRRQRLRQGATEKTLVPR